MCLAINYCQLGPKIRTSGSDHNVFGNPLPSTGTENFNLQISSPYCDLIHHPWIRSHFTDPIQTFNRCDLRIRSPYCNLIHHPWIRSHFTDLTQTFNRCVWQSITVNWDRELGPPAQITLL
eukprot:sb/3476053/